MKAYEIIERLFQYGKDFNYTTTCDTLKAGSPEAEVTKIAVTMNPTVNVIKDGEIVEKKVLILPKEVKNVFKCKNPRCITSIEQEIKHVFKLVNKDKKTYRCIYCDTVRK